MWDGWKPQLFVDQTAIFKYVELIIWFVFSSQLFYIFTCLFREQLETSKLQGTWSSLPGISPSIQCASHFEYQRILLSVLLRAEVVHIVDDLLQAVHPLGSLLLSARHKVQVLSTTLEDDGEAAALRKLLRVLPELLCTPPRPHLCDVVDGDCEVEEGVTPARRRTARPLCSSETHDKVWPSPNI